MSHRDYHPVPVAGCFGCKVSSIGYQGLRSNSADPVKKTPVTIEAGPNAGRVGGFHTHHWDGRVDATVNAPSVAISAKPKEIF